MLTLIKRELGGETPSEVIINFLKWKGEGHRPRGYLVEAENLLAEVVDNDMPCICGSESSIYVCMVDVNLSYRNYMPVGKDLPATIRDIEIRPPRGVNGENAICHECFATKFVGLLSNSGHSALSDSDEEVLYISSIMSHFYLKKSSIDIRHQRAPNSFVGFENIHIYTQRELKALWSDYENMFAEMSLDERTLFLEERKERRKRLEHDHHIRRKKRSEERRKITEELAPKKVWEGDEPKTQKEILKAVKSDWRWKYTWLQGMCIGHHGNEKPLKKGKVISCQNGVATVRFPNQGSVEEVQRILKSWKNYEDGLYVSDELVKDPIKYRFISN